MPRADRSNSLTPSARSTAATCCEMPDWVAFSRSAARVNEPSSQAAMTARTCRRAISTMPQSIMKTDGQIQNILFWQQRAQVYDSTLAPQEQRRRRGGPMGTATFGIAGLDWQQRVNWERLKKYRTERAREHMKKHGLGAMLCMYDENVRYLTGTLTPGWNRLKPGLRYALLCGDAAPVLFEQGDLGFQIERHSPWIPKENVRYSYAWIKGAAGPASQQQVKKFTDAILQEMKRYGVAGQKLGVDFIDINMINIFKDKKINWVDGMTPMMEARAVKNQDEQECMRIVGAIGDATHWECMKFLRPGITENQVTAHLMKYLYSIPGMEDVEDVIVSSGPNTWPNWRNFSDQIGRA